MQAKVPVRFSAATAMLAGRGIKEENKPQGTSLSALSTSLWLVPCTCVAMSTYLQPGQLISILLNNQAPQPSKKLATLKPTNTQAAWWQLCSNRHLVIILGRGNNRLWHSEGVIPIHETIYLWCFAFLPLSSLLPESNDQTEFLGAWGHSPKARPAPFCPGAEATHALPWGQAAHCSRWMTQQSC